MQQLRQPPSCLVLGQPGLWELHLQLERRAVRSLAQRLIAKVLQQLGELQRPG
ncbi:hypothetical protein NJH83_21845 [Pseudomonas chlororaphis]|uniref:hypothetical protein n=1 Tax=Pseudomonas chlororaphis TaxID=587753 RepID=UPI00209AC806|nr:hypothetical protein [Pseudomonas chlororaphis]MCO7612877.1 hypothetical protein [Pseudomonas chlororaphis]